MIHVLFTQNVSQWIAGASLALRFENSFNKKTLKRAWRFLFCNYLFVTTVGFKPTTAGAEIQCSIQLSYVANFNETFRLAMQDTFNQNIF